MKTTLTTVIRGLGLVAGVALAVPVASAATLAAGYDFAGSIDGSGVLRTWGDNALGQLGQGSATTTSVSQPAPVAGSHQWRSVAMGQDFTLAVDTAGALWAWGNNPSGQLGIGGTTSTSSPVKVTAFPVGSTVQAVAAGQAFSVAIVNVGADHGRIYAWGNNSFGQLGQGTSDNNVHATPLWVGSTSSRRYIAVTAAGLAIIAIDTTGALWAWGDNSLGECAQGGSAAFSVTTPTQVGTATSWTAVSAGYGHVLALQGTSLFAWGSNGEGQAGTGVAGQNVTTPVPLAPGTTWTAIGTGQYHSFAVDSSGGMWGWGLNQDGELDLPVSTTTVNFVTAPQLIGLETGLAPWAAATGGNFFTVARDVAGGVYGVGDNTFGELGNGTISSALNFTPAFGLALVSGVNLAAGAPVVPSSTLGVNAVAQPVTVTVQNSGSATLTTSYVVSVYLSNDGALDSGSLLLASATQSPPLAGLGSATVTFSAPNLAIPGEPPGAYQLFSQVTPVGGNPVTGGSTAVNLVGPDLTLQNLTVAGPTTVAVGGSLTGVTATLRNGNLGVVPAGTPLVINVWLGTQSTHTSADVQIGSFTFSGGLGANASVALPAQSFTVPSSVVGGAFQLFYTVNDDSAVAESGALPDFASTTIFVDSYSLAASAPQIAGSIAGTVPTLGTSAIIGQVNVSAQNLGSQAYTAGFTVSLYLSADGLIGANAVLLASVTDNATLNPNSSKQEVFQNVTVPLVVPSGYQLLGNITPAPGNANPNPANNTAGIAVQVVGPDLTLSNAVLGSGSTAQPGGSFTGVTYQLSNLNLGVIAAGTSIQVQTFLSQSASFSSATSTLLDQYTYSGGIAAGPSAGSVVSLPPSPRTINVPAGTLGGSDNLFFVVTLPSSVIQSAVGSGTISNVLAVPVTISAVDLAVTQPVTTTTSIGVNTSLGTVSTFVENEGQLAYSAGYTLNLFLSASPTLDGTATLLKSSAQAGSLAALASAAFNFTNVSIPNVAPGSYFLLSQVVLANGQTDGNLANNVAATPITIVAPAFTVGNFVFPNTTSIGAGSNFGNVTYRITDTGTGAVPVNQNLRVQVYLSTTTTFNPVADVLLDDYDYTGGLGAGGSVTLPSPAHTLNLPANTPNGVYQLLFVVNGDNAVAGAPVSVTAQQVAVGAINASVTAPSVATANIGVNTVLPSTSVTVNNLGGFAIPAGTVVNLYLSPDGNVNLGDPLLGTLTIASQIPGGTGRSVTFTGITVPDFGQGPFNLVSQIVLPPGLIDLNPAGNVAATPVTLNRPTLQISSIVVANTINLNLPNPQFTGVTFTLGDTSIGAVPAGTQVLLEVYLATSSTLNPSSQTLLFSTEYAGGLNGAAAVNIPAFNIPVPAGTVGGSYFLIFVANRDRNVNESGSVVATAARQVFLQKTNAPGAALGYGNFSFSGAGQWFSVTDTRTSTGQAFQSPVLAQGQSASITMTVTGPTTINAPWLIVGGATDTVGYTVDGIVPAAQTSGILFAGEQYKINSYSAGDDFTNVGAASNASGITFTATGTTPAVWTHGSSVQSVSTLTGFIPPYQPSIIGVTAGTHTIVWTYTQNSATTSAFARLDLQLPSFIASGDGSWFGVTDPTSPAGGTYAQSPILQPGQQATLQVGISGPALTSFWWRTASVAGQDTLSFFIDGKLSSLPTSTFFAAAPPATISGNNNFANVAFLVGPGTHTLSWVYSQNSQTTTSAGFVAGLQVLSPIPATNTPNSTTNPAQYAAVPTSNIDLAITNVTAPTGTYLLDDAAGTGVLPVSITLTDVGSNFASNPSFEAANLELHLSTDTIFGNSDDIDLGNFANLDTVIEGNQVVFQGDINLPFTIPTGNYYLLVEYGGGSEQPEFTLANNTAVVGPGFNVTRAPRLVISSFSPLASNYPYHPTDSVFLSYTLGNIGLADVNPSTPFETQVTLLAVPVGSDFSTTAGTVINTYAPVTYNVFLPQVSGENPNGGSTPVTNFLSLPSLRDTEVALGLVPAGTPEDDGRVFEKASKLDGFWFFWQIVVDPTNAIVQSSTANVWTFTDTFSMTSVPTELNVGQYFGQAAFGSYVSTESAALSGTTFNQAAAANTANGQFTALITAYATGQSLAGSPQTLFQFTNQNGFPSITVPPGLTGNYLTQTFDFNVRANDIAIDVQSSPDLATWTTLVTLSPPYSGTAGSQSLTGNGGLLDNPFVLAVNGNSTSVEEDYLARVTVRDSMPIASSSSRFMRLNIRSLVPAPTTPASFVAAFDTTTELAQLSWTGSLPTIQDPLASPGNPIPAGAFVIERASSVTPTQFTVEGSSTANSFSESVTVQGTYIYRLRAITTGGASPPQEATMVVPTSP